MQAMPYSPKQHSQKEVFAASRQAFATIALAPFFSSTRSIGCFKKNSLFLHLFMFCKWIYIYVFTLILFFLEKGAVSLFNSCFFPPYSGIGLPSCRMSQCTKSFTWACTCLIPLFSLIPILLLLIFSNFYFNIALYDNSLWNFQDYTDFKSLLL